MPVETPNAKITAEKDTVVVIPITLEITIDIIHPKIMPINPPRKVKIIASLKN